MDVDSVEAATEYKLVESSNINAKQIEMTDNPFFVFNASILTLN